MWRRFLKKIVKTESAKAGEHERGDNRTRHLCCPRCRRLLIVPKVDTFRCQCALVFRTSANDPSQLCFSLRDQESNGQGFGLPRGLVERMPVTSVTRAMCEDAKVAKTSRTEDEVKEEPPDSDNGTCRICLSEYKAGDSLRVLPCFHKFHVEEIDDWLDRNTSCPLCHLDVSEALTGSSGVAFVSTVDGNPTSLIERKRR